jgi:predicted MarR family transcription regulator
MSDEREAGAPKILLEGGDNAPSLYPSHLALTSAENDFYKFEFALHHITEAFSRWSAVLHEFISGDPIPAQDVSLLQTIRMNDRPKSAVEIGKFQNREDSSNILYALRKLEKAGYIRKSTGASRQTTYQVTDAGREVTDRYANLRKEILLDSIARSGGVVADLGSLTDGIWHISGLYEQAARKMTMMQMLQPAGERVGADSGKPADKPKRTRKAATAG